METDGISSFAFLMSSLVSLATFLRTEEENEVETYSPWLIPFFLTFAFVLCLVMGQASLPLSLLHPSS